MNVNVLVVGAGFAGCTAAERLSSAGKTVLVIDKRSHIGGNAYDCPDDHGVLIHTYGPHIFHTSYDDVWSYLSRFTEWRPYSHHVLALVDGVLIPLPFNLNSIGLLFPEDKASRLEELLVGNYGLDSTVPVLRLRESEVSELRELAEFVYDKVFRNYTIKQWGMRPEDLSPRVTERVPVRVSRDDRYFLDTYQAMPRHGYTPIFERMLDNPRITVELDTDYSTIRDEIRAEHTVYTGPIDEYFGYCFGRLPCRSLRFETQYFPDTGSVQPVAVVNYPNQHDFTRITEFKHLTAQEHTGTTIMREYPESDGDPYYPVTNDDNAAHLSRYWELAERETGVTFLGRLAEYRYYDMDDVVKAALEAEYE